MKEPKELSGLEWVVEVLSETFDAATDLMPDSAFVFGGVLRDLIAGESIDDRDLDICVAPRDFPTAMSSFRRSQKWYEKISEAPILIPVGKNRGPSPTWGAISASAKDPYGNTSVNRVEDFYNHRNRKVQLIETRGKLSPSRESVLTMIEQVDLICCGLAMSKDGTVLEVIDGAVNDCKAKVLRLNPASVINEFAPIKKRVERLVARGWKNKINMKKLEADVKKAKLEKIKKIAVERFKSIVQGTVHNAGNVNYFKMNMTKFTELMRVCMDLGFVDAIHLIAKGQYKSLASEPQFELKLGFKAAAGIIMTECPELAYVVRTGSSDNKELVLYKPDNGGPDGQDYYILGKKSSDFVEKVKLNFINTIDTFVKRIEEQGASVLEVTNKIEAAVMPMEAKLTEADAFGGWKELSFPAPTTKARTMEEILQSTHDGRDTHRKERDTHRKERDTHRKGRDTHRKRA